MLMIPDIPWQTPFEAGVSRTVKAGQRRGGLGQRTAQSHRFLVRLITPDHASIKMRLVGY